MTRLPSWQLLALAVAIWGTTWHAITYQLAVLPPDTGVAVRFSLASLAVLVFAAWRGDAWKLPWRAHGVLAVQGVFMYGLAYIGVYEAELHVPSGLVAVGYSASPLIMGLAARALWGTAVSPRFLAGGLLGVAGVALIFAPEIATVGARPDAGLGLFWTVAAVLLSAVGALAASRNHALGLPFWPALGWGLAWGAGTAALIAGIRHPLPQAWPVELSWWLSLGYLAVAGTVVAFAAFLTLQTRLGPGRASTVGVMTPVVALVVSAVFEGYRPEALTWAGLACTVAGNVLMLRQPVSAAAAG
jgi:drug/metabolite transporter (DMT)-like permease